MFIYNSLTATKQELKPITPNEIKLYVCGQTVYDYCHIGHARSMIVFDMVVRYFRARNFKVIFVRNITDIDDKIIKAAGKNYFSEAIHALELYGANVEKITNHLKEKCNVKGKALFMPLRIALTGHEHGPDLVVLFSLISPQTMKRRFERGIF